MELKPLIEFSPQDSPQEILTKILASRGLVSPQLQTDFLNPPQPASAVLAKQLGISASKLVRFRQMLQQAKQNKTQVCIFGDYDVDGLTSTAILWQALKTFGLDVLPFIPHRQKHGYGLSKPALQEIVSGQAFPRPFNPKLIITTDTGIVAHQEITWLKQQGYQVILTDHHQTEAKLPPADLVIHTTKTAAAGIAFLLAQTLLGDEQAEPLLELATLGVVADQIPLTGLNRNLVFHGLSLLQHPTNPGLQALYRQAGLTSNSVVDTYTIGFILAPRLNAVGRLEHGLDALRLLCGSNLSANNRLAFQLDQINSRRQELTQSAYQQALQQLDDSPLIVVASPDFHEGVLGLIAGKLVQTTHRPALAISLGKTLAKGSARSIAGFDITAFLRRYQSDLVSVGGHALAAGFSLSIKKLPAFIKKIKAESRQIEALATSISPGLDFEGYLNFSQLNLDLYQALQKLQPFGLGNPKPLFGVQARVSDFQFVGSQNQHLRLQLAQGKQIVPAIWFNFPPKLQPQQLTRFVFNLNLNQWRHRSTLQLILKYAD